MPTLFIRDVHRCKQECKNLLCCLEARRTKRMDTDTVAGRLVKHTYIYAIFVPVHWQGATNQRKWNMISHTEGVSFLHMLRQYYTTMSYIMHKKIECSASVLACFQPRKGNAGKGLKTKGKKDQLRKTRGHDITTEEPRYNSSISHENTFVIQ